MAWGVGGWLLTPFLQKIGPAEAPEAARARRRRTQDHLRQPLHRRWCRCTRRCSSTNIAVYSKRATGEKYLINPNKAG